jgi:Ca-activated chloride channel family protein
MSLLWPGFLFLFLLIPLVVAVYIWILRRRKRFAVRYSSLSLVREAALHQSWLRRHLPFILFLFALASLVFALGRPVATVTIPSDQATVILAIDVSRSMCTTDIKPNRLKVAQDAALDFIRGDRSGRQIGIVAFAGFAELVQPPTDDVKLLERGIESLVPARRTAIGSAILRSLDAIAEVDPRVSLSDVSTFPDSFEQPPVSEDELIPHIIVLLTDGSNNAGPYPLTAAQQAAERGVRVYTIGFGTVNNTSPMICGDQFEGFDQFGGFGSPFGGFGGSGGGFRRDIDEATLRAIADMTGGKYYAATSSNELREVFQSLPTYVIATRQTIEISVFFTALAALFIIMAVILSFLWHPIS